MTTTYRIRAFGGVIPIGVNAGNVNTTANYIILAFGSIIPISRSPSPSLPVFILPSYTQPAYQGTGGMIPITASQPYIINTLSLDVPYTCTAPMTSTGILVPTGSQFILSFVNPSPLTQALLTTWPSATMTFSLYTGESVTGLVAFQVTKASPVWQVLCTTLAPIQVQRWKVYSQFS